MSIATLLSQHHQVTAVDIIPEKVDMINNRKSPIQDDYEEDLQRLRGLRLIDDDFMAAVFEERACAEFLLQIILKRDDLTVKEVHGQYSIKNLQGRSVRLDILAVDRENRAYNMV